MSNGNNRFTASNARKANEAKKVSQQENLDTEVPLVVSNVLNEIKKASNEGKTYAGINLNLHLSGRSLDVGSQKDALAEAVAERLRERGYDVEVRENLNFIVVKWESQSHE